MNVWLRCTKIGFASSVTAANAAAHSEIYSSPVSSK